MKTGKKEKSKKYRHHKEETEKCFGPSKREAESIIKRVSWFKSSLLLRIQSDSFTNINS
jgi:hypothetical protein